MIIINEKNCENILIFKFLNFSLEYPNEINKFMNFSTNKGDEKVIEEINTLGKSVYKKIYILGLGNTEEFNQGKFFSICEYALNLLKDKCESLDVLDNLPEDYCYELAMGVISGIYSYKGFKSVPKENKLKLVNIITNFKESCEKGIWVGKCINECKDLINTPSNIANPKYICQKAEEISEKDNLELQILDKFNLEGMGMEGIMYVSKGSKYDPFLVVMQYFGDPSSKDIVAIVGKGITFDSGGISLKQKSNMEHCIKDMSGAAAVLYTMKAISKLKPKKNVIALMPLAENMPDGSAYKPGDVINTYSGKSIEVISTDAEGRLLLCDAISYAKELGANEIIDVATLTGSASNFFGKYIIPISSNSDELSKKLIECSKITGENMWLMPSLPEYLSLIESEKADLKNSSSSCGAIVAGMFLQQFSEEVAFAHLDIAGSPITSPLRTLLTYICE